MRSWVLVSAIAIWSISSYAAEEKTALQRGEYGPLDKAPGRLSMIIR